MQQDYIVLRAPSFESTDVMGGIAEATGAMDAVVLETHTLTEAEAEDVRNDPQALQVAPAMEVRLIDPVAMDVDAAVADQGAVAWGIQATGAATSSATGNGVVVAVLDTGIDAAHAAFTGKTLVQQDFTGTGNGDQHGHGTHCAGTIFGNDVDGVRIGVARGVQRALIGKVLDNDGRGTTKQALDGILWAVSNGANVISMSLGFDFTRHVDRLMQQGIGIRPATSLALTAYRDNLRLFDTMAQLVAAQAAVLRPVLIVAAAGNESARPQFEVATAPPAAAVGVLSVGALGKSGANSFSVAPFSNSRPQVAGPGVDVRSAQRGGGLTAKNGTSMATPHVAGLAALWFERTGLGTPAFAMSTLQGRLTGGASHNGIAAADRPNTGAGMVMAPP